VVDDLAFYIRTYPHWFNRHYFLLDGSIEKSGRMEEDNGKYDQPACLLPAFFCSIFLGMHSPD